MYIRTTAALLTAAGLIPTITGAQPPPNPTQALAATRQEQVPIFRMTVVGRTTPAINYRPRKGATKIDFVGTALLPNAVGTAEVEGKKGYIAIDARFDKLEPATRFGQEYLTYVLWAITPEGRATNLGEVQVDDKDARIQVTTELQSFGLILTAEPYFAVTQPSDVVVMENSVRAGTVGTTEIIQAKYELLNRGSYLMRQDASQLKRKPLEPGAPLDLAEARNAVALARIAGAERYAGETFTKAAQLLASAELARERKRGSNAIMMPARQAAQTAEDARLIALKNQGDEFDAMQRLASAQRETAALDRARAEEAARRQADVERQGADAARLTAERDRATADAARLSAERDRATADAARLSAERDAATADAARLSAQRDTATADAARLSAQRDTATADAARLSAERDKATADAALVSAANATAAAERARRDADAARAAAESQAQDAQVKSEREKNELRARVREQLNVILETRESARGLVVNLSDVLFDTGKAALKPGAREKLSRLSGVLLSHPGLHVEVEGHADSVGATDFNQTLSESRAASVRDYLVRGGIAPNTVGTAGFGESQPVASNDTAAGKQQNRRVELIVSGESIGRAR
jgi:outer membrane protein OmpA-like peptidoglycan-associated protein